MTNCIREEENPAEIKPELTENRGIRIGKNLPRYPKHIYWSRAGDEIIVRCLKGIYAVNIETDSIRVIDKNIETVFTRYSNDGIYLYYLINSGKEGRYSLGRLDLKDGATQMLVKNSVSGPFIISKDHEKIAFIIQTVPDPSIFLYTESTNNIQPVSSGNPRSINSDGTKMIIRDEKAQKIYLINLNDLSKTDLNLHMIYDYKYFWNADNLFIFSHGRILDVFNKTSRTTNLEGILGRSWTRCMNFDYYYLEDMPDNFYVTYYLINDNPYLKKIFATAIAFNFGYPTFSPDEQHAAYIINNKIYMCKLPF